MDSLVTSEHNLLSVHEVSVIFRVSHMTIYRLVRSGELRCVRVGRSYRIPRDVVEQFASDHYTVAA